MIKNKISAETSIGSMIIAMLLIGLFGFTPFQATNYARAQVSTSTTQTINITVNQTITLSLSSTTVGLGALTPGVAVFATSSATVSTNSNNGWNLKINRNSATSTLASSTITFPDFTSWNPAGSGNATTTVNVGANLHFKVANTGTDAGLYSSAWWGPNDTDGGGGALYAGFPTSSQTIASTTAYSGSAQIVVMRVRADAPATQQATSYTGQVTITAITNV